MSLYSQLTNWDISRSRIYRNFLWESWAWLVRMWRDDQPLQGFQSYRELCKWWTQAWITGEKKYRRKSKLIYYSIYSIFTIWTSLTYVCQHSQIILATKGSSSLGISRRRFWNPTAPTTCIGFIPIQGNFRVASSHKMTPKL